MYDSLEGLHSIFSMPPYERATVRSVQIFDRRFVSVLSMSVLYHQIIETPIWDSFGRNSSEHSSRVDDWVNIRSSEFLLLSLRRRRNLSHEKYTRNRSFLPQDDKNETEHMSIVHVFLVSISDSSVSVQTGISPHSFHIMHSSTLSKMDTSRSLTLRSHPVIVSRYLQRSSELWSMCLSLLWNEKKMH